MLRRHVRVHRYRPCGPPRAIEATTVSRSRRSVTASAAMNTSSGGDEWRTIPDHEPAANDDHVFMTEVAPSVNHFARRTHGPIGTPYLAVTCSARRIAMSTSDTVGSSSHAASHGSDHVDEPAAAKCWTLVIVNARPSVMPAQHKRST